MGTDKETNEAFNWQRLLEEIPLAAAAVTALIVIVGKLQQIAMDYIIEVVILSDHMLTIFA